MRFLIVLLSTSMSSFLTYASDELISNEDFFSQILSTVKNMGGIPWTLKIASIILIIIASMKVSFIRPLWDKLGWAKGLLAPVLGIIAGILSLYPIGQLTAPGVMAYMFAGAGAVVLHEMFEALKLVPSMNPTVLSVINFFESVLKAPDSTEIEKK